MGNGRPGRRRLARDDGRVIKVSACCALEITVSPTRLNIAHDNGCPALDPSNPAGMAARVDANEAVARALGPFYGRTMVVMAR